MVHESAGTVDESPVIRDMTPRIGERVVVVYAYLWTKISAGTCFGLGESPFLIRASHNAEYFVSIQEQPLPTAGQRRLIGPSYTLRVVGDLGMCR